MEEVEKEEWSPPTGKGTKLEDMPDVNTSIRECKDADMLLLLHRYVFGRPCKKRLVRMNLLQFSGVDAAGDEEKANVFALT